MMDGRLRNMTAIYLRCGEGMILLYRIGSKVIGDSYTGTAGGHFEKDELNEPKACVLRELYEETGLGEQDIENLALRYVALRLKNGEIRQNYYFFADLKEEVETLNLPRSTEGRLEWVPYEKLTTLKMPVSAKFMIQHYMEVGRYTNALYGGVATETGIDFVELREFSD